MPNKIDTDAIDEMIERVDFGERYAMRRFGTVVQLIYDDELAAYISNGELFMPDGTNVSQTMKRIQDTLDSLKGDKNA